MHGHRSGYHLPTEIAIDHDDAVAYPKGPHTAVLSIHLDSCSPNSELIVVRGQRWQLEHPALGHRHHQSLCTRPLTVPVTTFICAESQLRDHYGGLCSQ